MRLLVLGGSVFLSREVVAEALRRGHEVTAACRGASGAVPAGARHLPLDRTGPLPADLGPADAVVDVARHPSWVRAALDRLSGAHWVFVSTINVYADDSISGGRPGTLPLREPLLDDVDLAADPEAGPDAYGRMKVGCEQLVRERAASWTLVRPGLIVGPGDPTGRFGYWPARLGGSHPGSEVLAPGDPADAVQVVDVRDLAAWLVDCAERRDPAAVGGTFDGVGPAVPVADLLAEVAAGCGAEPSWTWVPQDFLTAHDVRPWSGPRSVPLWLPRPEYHGMLAHDAGPSLAAGLRVRPLADTARDTLAWLRATPGAAVTGLTRAEEAEVLAAWHAR